MMKVDPAVRSDRQWWTSHSRQGISRPSVTLGWIAWLTCAADGVREAVPDGSDVVALSAELDRLRAENARLQRLLDLRPSEALPPGPEQTGIFDAAPGPVDNRSSPEKKLAFYRALFAARPDVYAVRWENRRSGKSGWTRARRSSGRSHRRYGYSVGFPGLASEEPRPLTPPVTELRSRPDRRT